jgi:hypothetical protein
MNFYEFTQILHRAQMQSNPIPGQFLMSYWNGLSLSFPKLASNVVGKFPRIEAMGTRQSTDELIWNCCSVNWSFLQHFNKINYVKIN